MCDIIEYTNASLPKKISLCIVGNGGSFQNHFEQLDGDQYSLYQVKNIEHFYTEKDDEDAVIFIMSEDTLSTFDGCPMEDKIRAVIVITEDKMDLKDDCVTWVPESFLTADYVREFINLVVEKYLLVLHYKTVVSKRERNTERIIADLRAVSHTSILG